MNPNLVVCGDSYMSPVFAYPGKHLSEIVADSLNYNLIPLSRGGMSNGGIVLQIESALKYNPKLLLLGTSFPGRIEYPIKSSSSMPVHNADSILYKGKCLSVLKSYAGCNPRLISTNLGEILDDQILEQYPANIQDVDLAREKILAIRKWFELLYDEGWKTKCDRMMLFGALMKLEQNNIPYIICFDYVGVYTEYSGMTSKKTFMSFDFIDILTKQPPLSFDPGFHTNFETQELFASKILDILNDR